MASATSSAQNPRVVLYPPRMSVSLRRMRTEPAAGTESRPHAHLSRSHQRTLTVDMMFTLFCTRLACPVLMVACVIPAALLKAAPLIAL